MNKTLVPALATSAVIAAAFVAGRLSTGGADRLEAQGRGSRPPVTRRQPTPPPRNEGPLVYGGDAGTSGAANGFIAVTGSYGVGTSVLYVLDTVNKQLAVYEARGGSPGSRKVYLVGARKVDLDLRLQGYNDESEFEYAELRRLFDQRRGVEEAAEDAAGETPKPPGAARGK